MQSQTNLLELKTKSPATILHEEALAKAKRYQYAQAEILEVIARVEERKLYLQFEITNLHTYCVELLKLDSQFSYDCTAIISKAKEVPKLLEAIYSNKTTVSKLRKITSVVNSLNAKEWIDLVCCCSSRVVEKAVAQVNPKLAVKETLTYISGDALKIQFAVSEEWAQLLQKTKDRMSQKLGRAVAIEEALFLVMKEAYERHDPVVKAKRSRKRREKVMKSKVPASRRKISSSTDHASERATAQPCQTSNFRLDLNFDLDSDLNSEMRGRVEFKNAEPFSESTFPPLEELETSPQVKPPATQRRSRYIPAEVRDEVRLRDENRCAHVDSTGRRCANTRWLDQHHVVEFSRGGEHSAENLITLCTVHHQQLHNQSYV